MRTSLSAFIVAAGVLVSYASASQDESPLRPGEGRAIVEAACTSCHDAGLIVSARMSRTSWDTTISWMQETQGLGPLSPEVRATILDYLESTQGLPGAPGSEEEDAEAAESPWAYPTYRPNPIW